MMPPAGANSPPAGLLTVKASLPPRPLNVKELMATKGTGAPPFSEKAPLSGPVAVSVKVSLPPVPVTTRSVARARRSSNHSKSCQRFFSVLCLTADLHLMFAEARRGDFLRDRLNMVWLLGAAQGRRHRIR